MFRFFFVFIFLTSLLEARVLSEYNVFSSTQDEAYKIKLLNRYLNTLPAILLDKPKHMDLDLKSSMQDIKKNLTYKLLQRYNQQEGISKGKQWKSFSGWSSFLWTETADNQDSRGYASTKGLITAEEDFLSFGVSYFLPEQTRVEASLKCRTPRKYAFFKNHFKDFNSAFESKNIHCLSMQEGFLSDLEFIDPLTGQKIDMGPVSMDTVKGFELLYATPGTADASEIAGHLLLRIKLDNNPRATVLGLVNPNDLVISFLANTGDVNKTYTRPFIHKECQKNWFNLVDSGPNDFDAFESIFQSLKGLSGGFITMMDRQTLGETIKHYTIEEDRNLLRYELHLNKSQKKELLQGLYLAKKNYNSRYYFFPQNCASVLVKVISKGIDDKEISSFNPIVSPPNTLVSLFTRKGLASAVYPSFYSYRKKAYIAQDKTKIYYQDLKQKYFMFAWPNISEFFKDKVLNREAFVQELQSLYEGNEEDNEELNQDYYALLNMMQEAEMAYGHKDMLCENYTSQVSERIRIFQERLLKNIKEIRPLDIKSILEGEHLGNEEEAYKEGLPRTQLLSYGLGLGHYHSNDKDRTTLRLNGSIEKQNMGSISNLAMQRGNFVRMGDVDISLSNNSKLRVTTWEASLLKIQKFQDRLDTIPSYFSSAGNLGLGLSVLDFRGTDERDMVSGTIVGGKVLVNLFSSTNNNDFIYLSLGADVSYQKDSYYKEIGFQIPSSVNSLMSFGNRRQLQWRNKFEYASSIGNKLKDEIRLKTELTYQLGVHAKSLYLLRLGMSYDKLISSKEGSDSFSYTQGWIGLEVHPW